MIWVVLGFRISDGTLAVEYELPVGFTIETAAEWVGDSPELIGSSFPLSGEQITRAEALLGVALDPSRIDYFLEAQADP